MNIYLHELKNNQKFCLTWIVVTFITLVFILLFYPIFNEEMKEFITLIDNLPEYFKSLFGMNTKTIGSILGYYSFGLLFIIICNSISAMILGLNIFSKEIREKTADFLFTKPTSRIKIITSKLLSCLTWILISNILYLIGFYLILNLFATNNFCFNTYILLTLIILFLQIFFLALGTFLGIIIPKIKTVIPISLGIVFGFYLISTFTDDKLRIISIFKYFNISNILLTSSYESKYLIILSVISILLIISTYLLYKKKDIVL